jgi:hypothetical protein
MSHQPEKWERFPGVESWRVMRLDDNGNEVEVSTTISQCEALAIAAKFEARGHKQMYWTEALKPDDDFHPSSIEPTPQCESSRQNR